MILKPEFAHMVNSMGLEDGDLALAEIVWIRCEKAMQQKPQQESVLLNNKRTIFDKHENKTSLTQAELQSLTDGLANVLSHEQQILKNLKYRIDLCWRKSEPDDSDSVVYFQQMNEYRNQQRKIKKDHAKLTRIQYKLKKMM